MEKLIVALPHQLLCAVIKNHSGGAGGSFDGEAYPKYKKGRQVRHRIMVVVCGT
ncbi:MAG: hypothetical protein J6Y90_00420 [Lachnospiraceae bacterium]|nr:hypothetical protein [Lachnospiraceae bacterium]